MKKSCIIPGTFDPFTNGHIDLVERAVKIFDIIYVTVFVNSTKNTMFTSNERTEIIKQTLKNRPEIIVSQTEMLLADYVEKEKIGTIVKGVRGVDDYNYEYQLYMINKKIGNNIDTIFMPSDSEHLFISSSFVREMIKYKKPIENYIPKNALEYIKSIVLK